MHHYHLLQRLYMARHLFQYASNDEEVLKMPTVRISRHATNVTNQNDAKLKWDRRENAVPRARTLILMTEMFKDS